MTREDAVRKQIEESQNLKGKLKAEVRTIIAIADEIIGAMRRGNKVLLLGNGGSAADAQHIAGELAGRFYRERDPLPVIALGSDVSSLTAIANDYGYEAIFSRPLRGLLKKGDVVIALSTSGNSPNVLQAVMEAKSRGALTVAFTGNKGKLKELADFVLAIPSANSARIQEAYITAGHIICYLVEEALFG